MMARYVEEVMKFRRALNLTSVRDKAVFYARFIEASLALAQWMPKQGRLLDIGSGMGIPGIPLLIDNPALYGILVERRKKRAEFLRHIVRTLKLNAEVHDADIQQLDPLGVDICVARAVTREADLLRMCTPHAAPQAIAIFPVPETSDIAHLDSWTCSGEHALPISQGGKQRVRCYRYIQGGHDAHL